MHCQNMLVPSAGNEKALATVTAIIDGMGRYAIHEISIL